VPVCQAVQHAHQKGIIHRDLKPSNVLVAVHDVTPVPKVIDFGVAKAMGHKLTEQTLYTGLAQLVGTPLYMSPEQAGRSSLDADTRSDIYSLGVMLYELLTGMTPFDQETLRQAGYDEMRRIIREEEPPKPSTRLSTLEKGALSTVCECRGVEPGKLGQQVRGELDWIVMKALEKDRNRRYESASALAADVQRYLNDEPVEACPPSTSYRLRKFAWRYRRLLVTAGMFAAVLVSATVVSTWQAIQARQAQHQAEAAEGRAATEAAIARAVNDFLQHDLLRLVDLESQLDEGYTADRNLTVREALDRAAAKIHERFRDQPLVEAAVRKTMGEAFFRVGDPQLAVTCFERAYALCQTNHGPDHPDTFNARFNMAASYRRAGKWDEAVLLLEELFEKRKATHEPTDDTALDLMHNLAMAYENVGRLRESLDLHEKTLEILRATSGSDSDGTTHCMLTYARACQKAGQLDQADRLLRESLERRRKYKGLRGAALTADSAQYLALNLLMQKQNTSAELFAREALAIYERHMPDDWRRFHAMSLVGGALLGQQQYAAAESLLLQGYEGLQQREATIFAPQKQRVAESLERLVRFYEVTNQPEKARLWREKLASGNSPGN
jgi:non-specific serine/threonine protein kinase/serine/threonine-protein kinase